MAQTWSQDPEEVIFIVIHFLLKAKHFVSESTNIAVARWSDDAAEVFDFHNADYAIQVARSHQLSAADVLYS